MPGKEESLLAITTAVSLGNGLLKKLLDTLPSKVTERLLSQATVRNVSVGETILERGVHSEVVGYVLDGTLAMVQLLEDGRKHIVGLLVPTDIYGRVFDGPSNYRIEVLSEAQILFFPRAFFEGLLKDNPEAEQLFLVHLLDEVDAAREWLLLMSGRKAVNRLASFLSILARRSKTKRADGSAVVNVSMSRKDLAHYLGTRPETLSRAFRELELCRAVRMIDPYHFEIVDEEALVEASGDNLTFRGDEDSAAS